MANIIKPNIRELSKEELTFVAGGFSFTERQVSENIDASFSSGLMESALNTVVAEPALPVRTSSLARVDTVSEVSSENSINDSQPDVGLPSIEAFLGEFSVRPFSLNVDG